VIFRISPGPRWNIAITFGSKKTRMAGIPDGEKIEDMMVLIQ